MGTLDNRREVLIRVRGGVNHLCSLLYFCTTLKVDHDSSLALRILAGKPKTGFSLPLRWTRGFFIWKAMMLQTTHKQQSDYLNDNTMS